MTRYTEALDSFIGRQLALRGSLRPEHLAGFTAEEARELLLLYVDSHREDQNLRIEAGTLVSEPPGKSLSAPSLARPEAPSPVDLVAHLPATGALLDSAPSGAPFPKWAWWLPLSFGALGGVLAWLIVRDANRHTARNMLITGGVVQVVSIALSMALLAGAGGALRAGAFSAAGLGSSAGGAWPVTASGKPAFYYFGTST